MPAFDGTGPAGMGPMTGRGMGPCNPNFGGGYGYGRGMGRGFGRGGRGMGWGRMAMGPMYGSAMMPAYPQSMMPAYPQRITKDEEKEVLTEDLDALKQEVSDIEKRLSELDQEK